MADTLAVVDKPTFNWHDKHEGPLKPGDGPLKWRDYKSRQPLLDKYLEEGDRLFLVTARPGGRLWLVAVYEDVVRRSDGWWARRPNRTRIIDVTGIKSKLRFHTGNGLTDDDTKLGLSLQTPRLLVDGDIALLEGALRVAHQHVAPARRLSLQKEADEGQSVKYEIERYRRDPALVLARLQEDDYTCTYCGFRVDDKWFQSRPAGMSRVLHVHHRRPLADTGTTKTKQSDLITLCPTCHSVVHALSRATGAKLLGISLLKRYYRKPRSPA